jgi:hypothetical protein
VRKPSSIVPAPRRRKNRRTSRAFCRLLLVLGAALAPACLFDLPDTRFDTTGGSGGTFGPGGGSSSTASSSGGAGGTAAVGGAGGTAAAGGAGGTAAAGGGGGAGGGGCPSVTAEGPDASTLVQNHSFEEDLRGWGEYNASSARTPVPDAVEGSHVARFFDSDGDPEYGLRGSLEVLTGGTTYQVRGWVRTVTNPGAPIRIRFVLVDGTVAHESAPTLLTPCFTKIEASWTAPMPTDAGPLEARLMIVQTDANGGDTFDADMVDFFPLP